MVIKNCLRCFAVLFIILAVSTASSGAVAEENYSYLHQKDHHTWKYDLDGAWGKLTWQTTDGTTRFIFDGHKLKTEFNYTLIYFVDPLPGNGSMCIGTAKSNQNGNIHIEGNVLGPLPKPHDENYGTGAKIWLVNASDIDCQAQKFIKGTPEDYLYGTTWINIP